MIDVTQISEAVNLRICNALSGAKVVNTGKFTSIHYVHCMYDTMKLYIKRLCSPRIYLLEETVEQNLRIRWNIDQIANLFIKVDQIKLLVKKHK